MDNKQAIEIIKDLVFSDYNMEGVAKKLLTKDEHLSETDDLLKAESLVTKALQKACYVLSNTDEDLLYFKKEKDSDDQLLIEAKFLDNITITGDFDLELSSNADSIGIEYHPKFKNLKMKINNVETKEYMGKSAEYLVMFFVECLRKENFDSIKELKYIGVKMQKLLDLYNRYK